jgi:hypothetical protein
MNSVRQLYLPNAAAFASVVAEREELVPLYERTATSIAKGDAEGAAAAIGSLATAQERRMVSR